MSCAIHRINHVRPKVPPPDSSKSLDLTNETSLMPENESDSRLRIVASDEDFKKLAKTIIDEVHQRHSEFEIDPKDHYDDHKEIAEFLRTIREAKSSFRKTLLQLAFLGIIALAAVGFWEK